MLSAEWSILKVLWGHREEVPGPLWKIVLEDFFKKMALVWVLKDVQDFTEINGVYGGKVSQRKRRVFVSL